MKKTFLAFLAAMILFPAVSFANDFHPRHNHWRNAPVYQQHRWYHHDRREHLNFHRDGRWRHDGYRNYYHRYPRGSGIYHGRDDRPWHRFGG